MTHVEYLVQLVNLGVYNCFGHRDYEAIRAALDDAVAADIADRQEQNGRLRSY